MNTTPNTDDRHWRRYIETARRQSRPVKIDAVLQQRMRTFTAARNRQLAQAKKEG